MFGIVNYNIGNLASVQNALNKAGVDAIIESDPCKIKQYDKLLLPGVGAYGDAMQHLADSGMKDAVLDYVKSGKYLLGICLGMQILFDKSYEFGEHSGLGLIGGEIRQIPKTDDSIKIPHAGWNIVNKVKDNPLLSGLGDSFYLYFTHSYCVRDFEHAIGVSKYGIDFVSIVNKDNIFGIQPHPEKSHDTGIKMLKNFINL